MTGVRTIRATVRNATDEALAGLAGVTGVERHGDRVVLACSDSDVAIRALLERFTDVREIEISGADLEQAFLQLTGDTEAAAAMSAATYTRYELVRTFRNRRFFIFSLVFPLVLYYLIAGPNRDETDIGNTGISAPLYYMVGLAAYGAMTAMIASGARIAAERSLGWNRQLRITPLSTRAYFRAKVLTGYTMAVSRCWRSTSPGRRSASPFPRGVGADDGPDPRRPGRRSRRSASCSVTS